VLGAWKAALRFGSPTRGEESPSTTEPRWWVTPTVLRSPLGTKQDRESATENRPPMGRTTPGASVAGKGETVR